MIDEYVFFEDYQKNNIYYHILDIYFKSKIIEKMAL